MNRRDIYNKYAGHCAYCGKKIEFDDMTIDHIIPSSKGGANTLENTIPSCQLCNNQKADKSIEEFRSFVENITEVLDVKEPLGCGSDSERRTYLLWPETSERENSTSSIASPSATRRSHRSKRCL